MDILSTKRTFTVLIPDIPLKRQALSSEIKPSTLEYTKLLLNNGLSMKTLLAPIPNEIFKLSANYFEAKLTETTNKLSSRAVTQHGGEKRIIIQFESFGWLGKYPQTFGKNQQTFIPDGLVGRHRMYLENWKFELHHHEDQVFESDNLMYCVPISWKMINLSSGKIHNVKETKKEVILRMTKGRTIASRVFKEAIEFRAKQLEEELESNDYQKETARCKGISKKIRRLRPTKFSEGTLSFGLQHDSVQEFLQKNL